MSKLKRYYAEGQSYFVTIISYRRKPIPEKLYDPLYNILMKMALEHETKIDAWVILPDHVHLIVTPNKNVLNQFVHDVKLSFGVAYRKALNINSGRLWQRRYWDHITRSQNDMNRHFDYIHFNPVKHKYVTRPLDWLYSSIHEYKDNYTPDWGVYEAIRLEGDYGE